MLRHLPALLAGAFLLAGSAFAQLPSIATLRGTYNFRYLGVNSSPRDVALSFQGTVVFDGQTDANGFGHFTVTGQGAGGATPGPAANNIYGVLSSGLFYMTNPFDSTGNTFLSGGLGRNGVLIASSTDTVFIDFLVAVPVATSASTATLSGNYFLSSVEFLGGDFTQSRGTFFSATANAGSFGNVTIRGGAQNVTPGTALTQTSNGVAYTATANGTGTLNFPAPTPTVPAANQLLSGNKVMYVSQDGNFFVAGGATAFDLIVGVKALTGSAGTAANGLYFSGYLDTSFGTDGTFAAYASIGASVEIPSLGVEIGHRRINPDFTFSYDDSYSADFKPTADGTVTYSSSTYVVGAAGDVIMGSAKGLNYQLELYVKAPTLGGPGVFLNPQAIINAANNVPFTAGVSPGEFVSLVGTGLAAQTVTASSLPFPTTLGGVQVSISWLDDSDRVQTAPAPLYYVSPTLINLVVPYTTPGSGAFLNFRVTSNGTQSNIATVYSGPTSPGVFTVPSGGIGNGAILHADFTLVSPESPARVGETVQIFLTGLGAVTPAVNAGAAGPTNPLSTVIVPDVYIDGFFARTLFAGLAPTLGGLYQLNVTIPTGVTAGANVTLEIDTYDSQDNLLSVNAQATIPIAK